MIDLEDIHDLCSAQNSDVRAKAAEALGSAFLHFQNKQTAQRAWEDLHRLVEDKNSEVRSKAAEALASAYPHIRESRQQAWDDLIKLINDRNSDVKHKASSALRPVFPHVPDKRKAWDDLIKLRINTDHFVRGGADSVINRDSTFNYVPDKQKVWDDLVKYGALEALCNLFYNDLFHQVPDKQKAWSDFIDLITGNSDAKYKITHLINSAFRYVPDKQKAWNDLIKLTKNKNEYVRSEVLSSLNSAFSHFPDKQRAWDELIKLTTYEDQDVRNWATNALGSALPDVPDKQQAWSDLNKLTNSEYRYVRQQAATIIGSTFSQISDKKQAWSELHKLTIDENSDVRSKAASALGSAFSYVPDKQQAWDDLFKLIKDEDSYVRSIATSALGFAYPYADDKQKVWNVLHRLTLDNDGGVRSMAAKAISCAFSHIPNKKHAWDDIIILANDEFSGVRSSAVDVIYNVLTDLPDEDKQHAWKDLIELTNTEGEYLQHEIEIEEMWSEIDHSDEDDWQVFEDEHIYNEIFTSLCSAFSLVPDKQQAWEDLNRSLYEYSKSAVIMNISRHGFSNIPDKQQVWNYLLTLINDENSSSRLSVVGTLYSIYSQMSDKEEVWNDSMRLTTHQYEDVRAYAYQILGEMSVPLASMANNDEDYKKELQKTIVFFDKANQESPCWIQSPSHFYLPLYRSFYAIVFTKQEIKEEDLEFLHLKYYIGGRISKLLFKIVENLANALKHVLSLGHLDLDAKRDELNSYEIYGDHALEYMSQYSKHTKEHINKHLNHAAELMREAEKEIPVEIEVMRKGQLILERKLVEIFKEIDNTIHNNFKEPFSPNIYYENWKLNIKFEDPKKVKGKLTIKAGNRILLDRHLTRQEIESNLIEINYLENKYFPEGKDQISIISSEHTKPILRSIDYLETMSDEKIRILQCDLCNNVSINNNLRVASVQLKYHVYEENSVMKIITGDAYFNKIMKILEVLKDKTDIIVFPEFSIPFDALYILQRYSDENSIIIVAGSHYVTDENLGKYRYFFSRDFGQEDLRKNISPIVIPFSPIIHNEKLLGAQDERGVYSKVGMKAGNVNHIIKLHDELRIGIMICYEFLNNDMRRRLNSVCNVLLVPQTNPKPERFYTTAKGDTKNNLSSKRWTYIMSNGIFTQGDDKEVFGGCTGIVSTLEKYPYKGWDQGIVRPIDNKMEQFVLLMSINTSFDHMVDRGSGQVPLTTGIIYIFEESEIISNLNNEGRRFIQLLEAIENCENKEELKELLNDEKNNAIIKVFSPLMHKYIQNLKELTLKEIKDKCHFILVTSKITDECKIFPIPLKSESLVKSKIDHSKEEYVDAYIAFKKAHIAEFETDSDDEFDGESDDEPDDSTNWYNKWVYLFNHSKYQDALKPIEKALNIKPNDEDYWFSKGLTLLILCKYKESLKAFEKALEVRPDLEIRWGRIWFNKGLALSGLSKYEEALKAYEKAIRIQHDYESAWSEKGMVLLNLGRYEEALNSIEKALEIKPDYEWAWYNRACYYSHVKNVEEAIYNLQRSIELNSSLREKARNDNKFNKLRLSPNFIKITE